MREIVGDMFDPSTYIMLSNGNYLGAFPDAICITTNGFTKANGCAVMGRGCAKQAATRWPGTPELLGNKIRIDGNRTQHLANVLLNMKQVSLISFPVKPKLELAKAGLVNVVKHLHHQFEEGQQVPGWACKARMDLIRLSAQQLLVLANEESWQTVVIPRPGCGAGELSWVQVKPLLAGILDDRFCAITTRNAY
jgi:hypothetical protein